MTARAPHPRQENEMADYYDDEPENGSVAAPDERLALMQEFVTLDEKSKHLEKQRAMLGEQADKIERQMRQMRNRLGGLLGFTDPMADAKASLNAEVEKLRGGAR